MTNKTGAGSHAYPMDAQKALEEAISKAEAVIEQIGEDSIIFGENGRRNPEDNLRFTVEHLQIIIRAALQSSDSETPTAAASELGTPVENLFPTLEEAHSVLRSQSKNLARLNADILALQKENRELRAAASEVGEESPQSQRNNALHWVETIFAAYTGMGLSSAMAQLPVIRQALTRTEKPAEVNEKMLEALKLARSYVESWTDDDAAKSDLEQIDAAITAAEQSAQEKGE